MTFADLGGTRPDDFEILTRWKAKQVSHLGLLRGLIQSIEPVSQKTLACEPQYPREFGDNGEVLDPDRFRRMLEQRRK